MIAVASGPGKTITMGSDQPTVANGERINPSGKKKLAVAIAAGVTWPTLAPIKMRRLSWLCASSCGGTVLLRALLRTMGSNEAGRDFPPDDVLLAKLGSSVYGVPSEMLSSSPDSAQRRLLFRVLGSRDLPS